MHKLKADGRISPFYPERQDVGNAFMMLHEAVALLEKVWLQPPHWDREPTKEMLEEEQRLEEESEEANKEVERLAGQIYLALTGKIVRTTLKESWCPEKAEFCHADGTNPAHDEIVEQMKEEKFLDL